MRSVVSFMEYRDFLQEFYNEEKSLKPYFSYRYMGMKVGMDPSHLVKVLHKNRHIPDNLIEKLILFLRLNKREGKYFGTLVQFNKTKSNSETRILYEQLLTLRGIHTDKLELQEYEFFSKWYYPAIMALLDFHPFDGDFKKLSNRLQPAISESESRKAVEVLSRLGFIEKVPSGGYRVKKAMLSTGEPGKSIAVRAFQEEAMKLAIHSLQTEAPANRNISSVTITLETKDLPALNEAIREFRGSILKFAQDARNPDKVYQLNIQLFPISK